MSSAPSLVRFRAAPDDVLEAVRVATRRSGAGRDSLVPPLVIAAFCLLGAFNAWLAAAGAGMVIGFLLAAPVSALLVRRLRAARIRAGILRQAEANGLLGERTLTLEDEGIRATTAWGDSLVRWDALEVVRGARHVLLLVRGAAGIAVPHAALGDAAAVDAFAAELERRAPRR